MKFLIQRYFQADKLKKLLGIMFARMRVSEEKPEKSIMAGEKRDSEPVFMHRLFEEGILKYASREKPALIYEGKQ